MTSDTVRRWVRALTLPSVLFASGLAGHAAAGGLAPVALVIVPLFVVTVVLVAPFAGAATSPARAVALLAGGQGLLHAALQQLGGTAVTATTTMCGAPASGMAAMPSPTGAHPMTHQCAATSPGSTMSAMSGGHVAMLLAHLAAAVVVGAWLVAGERAFWTLLGLTARPVVDAWRTVREMFRGGDGTLVASCRRLRLDWGLPFAVHGSVWAAGVVTRRGPPVTAPEARVCAVVSMV
jgi:hypothetical protein